jgi:hypothetical protein
VGQIIKKKPKAVYVGIGSKADIRTAKVVSALPPKATLNAAFKSSHKFAPNYAPNFSLLGAKWCNQIDSEMRKAPDKSNSA